MSDLTGSESDIEFLLSPEAVRERAELIYQLVESGEGNFRINADQFEETVDYIISVIKDKYPDLNIPYHSRWGHFQVGHGERITQLEEKLADFTPEEKAKAKIDLALTSVLLDAGAGPDWKYNEEGRLFGRSEGLAVASFHLFMAGGFSSDGEEPMQADSSGLMNFTEEKLKEAFQVSVGNALIGVSGRTQLMHELGKCVEKNSDYFDGSPKRPGNIVDYLTQEFPNKKIPASILLKTVLKGLGPIWPGRLSINGVALGDVWSHPALGEGVESLVPFHKLSQWLTYSLMEPLEECGFEFLEMNQMTGLAEYRNGGLMIDSKLIEIKDKEKYQKAHHPDSELIIEWRALTIALIDRLAVEIRKKLKLNEENFPLVKVLEGGTWWAGRRLAQKKRDNGDPPLLIISDGTVF